MNKKLTDNIQLDRNEAPYDLSREVKSLIVEALTEQSWNRYPSMFCEELIHDIAAYHGVQEKQILVDNGSSGVIRHLIGVYQSSRRRLVYPRPGFELFELCSNIYSMQSIPWPVGDDMLIDYGRYPGSNGSIYILCNPNNPTGELIDPAFVEGKVCEEPDSIFIIDEAYIEFSGKTLKRLALSYPNAIITRSMSKAVGLAGIRLGYAICHEDVADSLQRLQVPYRINQFTSLIASHLIRNYESLVSPSVDKIVADRDLMWQALQTSFRGSGHLVYPSQGNFLLLQIADRARADALVPELTSRKISINGVRDYPRHFRVTVGTTDENAAFLNSVSEVLELPVTALTA